MTNAAEIVREIAVSQRIRGLAEVEEKAGVAELTILDTSCFVKVPNSVFQRN